MYKTMKIGLILKDYKKITFEQKSKKLTERAEILKEIEDLCYSKEQIDIVKKANWKNYIQYLKDNKYRNSNEKIILFKKTKKYTKKIKIWFFLSHIPTKDLYFILSVVKDKVNRRENTILYILSLHKQL